MRVVPYLADVVQSGCLTYCLLASISPSAMAAAWKVACDLAASLSRPTYPAAVLESSTRDLPACSLPVAVTVT